MLSGIKEMEGLCLYIPKAVAEVLEKHGGKPVGQTGQSNLHSIIMM